MTDDNLKITQTDGPGPEIELPEDVANNPEGFVKLWLLEIDAEGKAGYDKWRKRVAEINRIYRDDKRTKGSKYNILWANTQVLMPALYSRVPQPDVRRRWRQRDPVGRFASQVLERSLSFTLDDYDFNAEMGAAVLDYALAARGVLRIDYEPSFGEGTDPDDVDAPPRLLGEDVRATYVDWRRFRHDPQPKWRDVRWVAYEHDMTRQDIRDLDGVSRALADRVELEARNDEEPQLFRTGTVWEIWDKENRRVVFIAEGLKDRPLVIRDDPLGLADFFNTPQPMYMTMTNDSLVPVPEYTIYQDQARELNLITTRITKLVDAIRARGAYDGTLKELNRLMSQGDNELVAVNGFDAFVDRGGFANSIYWLPIEEMARVLVILYQQRAQLLDTIFQITGISDIIRGATDPRETASAQRLKGQFGSFRLRPKQDEVQRYVRDLFRIMAEVIAEQFGLDTLQAMTQVEIPTQVQKQQMSLLAAQAQAQQVPLNPQIGQMLQRPTWEEVMQTLRLDSAREFTIDVETDTTVAPDEAQAKAEVNEYLAAVGNFLSGVGPLVEGGLVPAPFAARVLQWASGKYKVSREIEDDLNQIAEQSEAAAQQPRDEGPNIELIETQIDAQIRQAELALQEAALQSDNANKAADRELKLVELESKAETEAMKIAANERVDTAKLVIEAGRD